MAGCSSSKIPITSIPTLTKIGVPISTVTPSAEQSFTGKIAFISGEIPNYHIFVMNADGSKLVDITPPDLPYIAFLSWSPDGQYIAFDAWKDDKGRIFKMRFDGSDLIQLTIGDVGGTMPSWSPDGKNIMFVSSSQDVLDNGGHPSAQIYIMNSDGTRIRRFVVQTKPNNAIMTGYYRMDGLIAISEPITRYASTNYVVNSEGVIQKQFPEFATDLPIAWSPDGKFVAYLRGGRVPGCSGIVIMKFDTSEQKCLMDQKPDSGVYIGQPSWSPDGKYILFSSNLKGRYHTYVIHPDGSGLTQLANIPEEADWVVWWMPLQK